MRKLDVEVLVIGGGSTGTGVLRDLAMRGFRTALVEKGDLTNGTTGRFHGLLHSGARYAVRDPQAAKECIQENRVLRQIMPHCIEDTGGFFVETPWDDPDYAAKFLQCCEQADIPADEIPVKQMLAREPLLNPAIRRCFQVPDASADSFLATDANADSARQHGAQIYLYYEVTELNLKSGNVVSAVCHDLAKDENLRINFDLAINATGAWAGQIAKKAGVDITIRPGKGTMLAVNHRIVNTVINRCKLPSDGDILVPAHTVAIIGTTDVETDDPDHYSIEPWEIEVLLTEGEKIIPGFRQMRFLRAWAGVRPHYIGGNSISGQAPLNDHTPPDRELSREFVLLDHQELHGIEGLLTITSGKWTTHRKMAEVTVDLACEKLKVKRKCRTHLESLPGSKRGLFHSLGERLRKIDKTGKYKDLVCECELVAYEDVRNSIIERHARTIDDIRRDTRLGMGPCQGGFCSLRAAGVLHELASPLPRQTNQALQDFLQERWKGLQPVLWGQQLRQERLDELIFLSLLNIDHLPVPTRSPYSAVPYNTPESRPSLRPPSEPQVAQVSKGKFQIRQNSEILIIGTGLAGLIAGGQAASKGLKVHVISQGGGTLLWHAGCIDLLGYLPSSPDEPLRSPAKGVAELFLTDPNHPYSLAGMPNIEEALLSFQYFSAQQGYPMLGTIGHNWLLPTAAGAFRPTCLAPQTMLAGEMSKGGPALIIGFEGYLDFNPKLIADNFSHQGIPAASAVIDPPSTRMRNALNNRQIALLFENKDFLQEVNAAVKSSLQRLSLPGLDRIGFPAVLGIENPIEILNNLQELLGLEVFEIPGLPPSIPGLRIQRMLVNSINQANGLVSEGLLILPVRTYEDLMHIKPGDYFEVYSAAAARTQTHKSKCLVIATGGLLGGGSEASYEGSVIDNILGLSLEASKNRNDWTNPQFSSHMGHPIFKTGLSVNRYFQILNDSGKAIHPYLYGIGTGLAGGDFIHQRSFDGVALVSGYVVGKNLFSTND